MQVINDRVTERSKGFGFVTFASKDLMRDAIEGMNKQNLDGRNVIVNEAQSCKSRSGGDGNYESGGG